MNTNQFERKLLSAKAPANVKKTSEGFLLQNNEGIKRQQGNIISRLIGRLISISFILIFVFLFWWFFLLIAVVSILFNKNFRNQVKNSLVAQFCLFPAEVLLSSYPLRLGEECNLIFRRRFKGNLKTKQPEQLTFKIACVERVEYKKGTDTEIEVHTIWESQPQFHSVPTDVDIFSFKTIFTVPNDLPPSFEGKNNQIRWIFLVEQNILGVFERINSSFVFIVDPVLVK
ncbi:hypothetical protein [Anabaena sp. CCY 9910]|uniref:hypothetical protein n=1 Tax=Anabaena sp. CCY 9910 TaxID=3103870 RepID=UPI0039E06987